MQFLSSDLPELSGPYMKTGPVFIILFHKSHGTYMGIYQYLLVLGFARARGSSPVGMPLGTASSFGAGICVLPPDGGRSAKSMVTQCTIICPGAPVHSVSHSML